MFDSGQDNCLAISSHQSWLVSFPFYCFKGQSLKIKTFQNFSRLFHCSVINVLKLFFVISSPEQLWYLIMLFSVCQELFSTFLFFFFAIWPEVLSIFFVEAFVLRRFLNSEVYNTIVLFVCQQLFSFFSFFSIFSILLFVSHIAAGRAVVFINPKRSGKKCHASPATSYIFHYISL